MEITDAQYRQIEPCLPTQRGNVTLDNLHVLNAILYVAEQGGKGRGLSTRFGNWHTMDTRMTRWSKSGVLDRVFAQLHHTQIIHVKIEAVALDRPLVKVHPDGTGALKKNGAQAIGRSRGGWPTTMHMVAADARTAIPFALSPGQAHDAPEGRTLRQRFGSMPRPIHLLGSGRMKVMRRGNWPWI
jgi:transposase